jgi:hypothetical protein
MILAPVRVNTVLQTELTHIWCKSHLPTVAPQFDGIVRDIRALVRWEVRYNFALTEQLA